MGFGSQTAAGLEKFQFQGVFLGQRPGGGHGTGARGAGGLPDEGVGVPDIDQGAQAAAVDVQQAEAAAIGIQSGEQSPSGGKVAVIGGSALQNQMADAGVFHQGHRAQSGGGERQDTEGQGHLYGGIKGILPAVDGNIQGPRRAGYPDRDLLLPGEGAQGQAVLPVQGLPQGKAAAGIAAEFAAHHVHPSVVDKGHLFGVQRRHHLSGHRAVGPPGHRSEDEGGGVAAGVGQNIGKLHNIT